MKLLDENNLITTLVWSGWVDRAKCGELKKAIELCEVEALPISILDDIKAEIIATAESWENVDYDGMMKAIEIIDKYIGKENE